MANGQGTVTLNFGVFPGAQEASVAFADVAISGTSKVEAYAMAGDTAGLHTANDHRYFPLFVGLSAVPSAGVGGSIHARAPFAMIGQWSLRYIWTD